MFSLTPDFEQSGAYVKNWLRALNDDKRLIFKAASEAQKAADLLMERVLEGTPGRLRKRPPTLQAVPLEPSLRGMTGAIRAGAAARHKGEMENEFTQKQLFENLPIG